MAEGTVAERVQQAVQDPMALLKWEDPVATGTVAACGAAVCGAVALWGVLATLGGASLATIGAAYALKKDGEEADTRRLEQQGAEAAAQAVADAAGWVVARVGELVAMERAQDTMIALGVSLAVLILNASLGSGLFVFLGWVALFAAHPARTVSDNLNLTEMVQGMIERSAGRSSVPAPGQGKKAQKQRAAASSKSSKKSKGGKR